MDWMAVGFRARIVILWVVEVVLGELGGRD